MPRLMMVWEWQDAFSKWGFMDGDGWNGTHLVSEFIESLGYEVECDTWGIHNYLILDIREKIVGTDATVSILFNPNNKVGDDLDDWNDECRKRMRAYYSGKEEQKEGETETDFDPLGYADPESYLPQDLIDSLNEEFHNEYEVYE